MNKFVQSMLDGFAEYAYAENPAARIGTARNAEASGPLNESKETPAAIKPADASELTPLR